MSRRTRSAAPPEALSYRQLEVRATSIDEPNRSIVATISTEAAVPMPDWDLGRMIPEVLLTRGVQFPSSRQVPLLDSHSRWSVDAQLGSVREIAPDGDSLKGRLFFSQTAEDSWTKVREGHITDVSAGYQFLERIFVPEGKKKTIRGREFEGPVHVVTKWKLREVSITPIGADEQAKLRGLDPAQFPRHGRPLPMNPELRALLVERGMSADLDDQAALAWLTENRAALIVAPANPNPAPNAGQRAGTDGAAANGATLTPEAVRNLIDAGVQQAIKAIDSARAALRTETQQLCELAGIPDFAVRCESLADVAAVRKAIIDEKARRATELPTGPRITVTSEGSKRFADDVGTALSLRAISSCSADEKTLEKVFPAAKRSKGADTFRHTSLYEIARQWVEMQGVDTRSLTREDVAVNAMFGPEKAAELGFQSVRSNPGYHVTASFANLTLDAVNKSMMVGYTEAPSTWEGPMRRGTSVPDFKTIHRIRLGAVPNLPVWNDNDNPKSASLADAREFYAVECRSLDLSFSYKLIVNDDMDALSRGPMMLGAAARRTVNAVAWAQITSNPTMSDSVALFSAASGARKRDNLITGSATPTTTTIASMTKLMRLMRGENTPEAVESDDVLNLQPKYIVGPAALELLIGQAVNSAYDPNSTAGLQNYNPNRVLMPIVEPLLDAASATAWYLFASPSQIDTVEVSFLQGQENPVVRNWLDPKTLAQHFTVLQTFGAKAMNHRGIIKHAGA